MTGKKLKVGVIGCGNISDAYFKHAKSYNEMQIIACADLREEAAQAKAEQHGLKALSVEKLLADPGIDMILNLTIPQAHAEINKAALTHGKHTYCEKPFATDFEEARSVLELARGKGLRVGCAPDTFLGGGIQTARKLIDDGFVGKAVSGTAFMMCPGHESWHPNPGFYYLKGGGPVMDMGPYYITALVNLLGPVAEVAAMASMSGERTATSEKLKGTKLPVEINTHVAGTLLFENGAVVTLVMSFDTLRAEHHPIEIHGTRASLQVPDPNTFGGEVKLARRGQPFAAVPLTHGYTDNYRSLGLADMARAIKTDRPHRASGELAFHVLEVMLALDASATGKKFVSIRSRTERPAPLPLDLLEGFLD